MGLKVNAGKSNVMVLGGEKELVCEVFVDGMQFEHGTEFKYLECVLDESGTDVAKCRNNMTNGMKVVGAIRSLVNIRDLQFEEYTNVLRGER